MSKSKEITSVTKAAGMAAKNIARMEACAELVRAEETKRRSLQLVSSSEQFSALIRHGKTTFQFEGDSFALRPAGDPPHRQSEAPGAGSLSARGRRGLV